MKVAKAYRDFIKLSKEEQLAQPYASPRLKTCIKTKVVERANWMQSYYAHSSIKRALTVSRKTLEELLSLPLPELFKVPGIGMQTAINIYQEYAPGTENCKHLEMLGRCTRCL